MSNPPEPKQAFIVSHTHWDREWYLTFGEFRVDLARIVRKVLDALEAPSGFRHFVMDGQSIILEDYLEAHPEDEDRIRKLVRSGSLSIGPWYILPDEFLVSAESAVRNLLLGHKVAAPFGSVQRAGYMPDSFGHIAQMPQILRLADLDSFIYTRGNGDEIDDLGLEYTWKAPDGSEVLAIHQCGGYCNAAALGFEELWHAHTRRNVNPQRAVEQIRDLFAKMSALTNCDVYLLNNGCDHLPPQQRFDDILGELRQAFPKTEFHHTGFEDYIDAVKSSGAPTKTYQGELAGGRFHHILSGVWSSRMYLKQQNDRSQTLLSNYVEPMSAYAHFVLGRPYPSGLIESFWKLLLKNHPHDSICGCSTDEVHRAMEARFDEVVRSAEQLLREQLRALAPTFARNSEDDKSTVICVANPLPESRTEVVQRLVVLQPFGIDVERLRLFDASGRQVPFVITGRQQVRRFWAVDYRTELFPERQRDSFETYLEDLGDRIKCTSDTEECDTYLTVRFLAEDLPALGHSIYFLREAGGAQPQVHGPLTVRENVLENEFYRVEVHPNGTFDLFHKETGHMFPGLNLLEDTEDVGDEYDYSPCESSKTFTTRDCAGQIRVLDDCGLCAAVEVRYPFRLPQSIRRDRKRRSDSLIPCNVGVRIGLLKGSRAVEIDVEFENCVKDHRLRAVFPTTMSSQELISDGHFYTNHRSLNLPDGEGWAQPPTGTFPQQDYSLVQDGLKGLAVLNRGLPEIAALRDDRNAVSMHLTLLRSVGWLSRDDFGTRNSSNAGPTIRTPEAQCIGPQRFHYAVVAFRGDSIEAGIKSLSQKYKTPLMAVQGVEDGHVPGTESFLVKKTSFTTLSAVKKHETRDTLLLRLYNLTPSVVRETLTFRQRIRGAWKTNLKEERIRELGRDVERELALGLDPFEILVLEVDLTPSGPVP